MVFSSLTFLFYFLPITLIVNFLLPKSVRNYWLLLTSLVFYAWGAHTFVLVMIISILANYLFARIIDTLSNQNWRRVIMILAVIFNLSLLFYNKYLNFTTSLMNQYISSSIPVTEIALPIGISFFTFQAMSYVLDVYRKDVPVQKNPYYIALYVAFFPQLVAGPIVRYTTVEAQIQNRTTNMETFRIGVSRFMSGFCQKILLSNTFAVIADEAFDLCAISPQQISILFAWTGAIAYTLQIFFDFSGYSSMAIGLGRMFGFTFLENFNYPYIAKNITDFWHRWHISLSHFFRDYVYFPLGGSRVSSTWKLMRNLFVVWLLTGIWHGANFTFLFWGLGYFFLLSFEKLTNLPKRKLPAAAGLIYRIFTLLCVCGLWVVFRAENLRWAWNYLSAMIGRFDNPLWDSYSVRYLNDYKLVFLIGILFCTPVFRCFQNYMDRKFQAGKAVALVYDLVLVGGMLLSISCLVIGSHNPFIYFNF